MRSLAAILFVLALGIWILVSDSSRETRPFVAGDSHSATTALDAPVAKVDQPRAAGPVPQAGDGASPPPGTVVSSQGSGGAAPGSGQYFEAGALSCRLERDSSERITLRDCADSPLLERGEQGARVLLAELAPAFGFPADLSDLELVDEKHGLGSSRTLFRQTLNGLPVYDSSVSINQGADGSLQAAYSNYHPLTVGSSIPDLTSAESETIARAEGGLDTTRLPTVSELVWHSQFKGVGRLAWKLVIYSEEPLGDFLTLVDAQTGKVLLQENRIVFDTGSGFVFDPNPIQTSGNEGLLDNNDATSAALDAERSSVTLLGLDSGVGTLKGEFVDLVSLAGGKASAPDADEPTRVYEYDRSNARFEQVVIYYSVDSIQRYFHSLGFDDDVGIANGIRDFPTLAHAHWNNADQSFFSSGDNAIHFGDGGVDDGEDADIIAHEFGHAVQDDQNACWGGGDMGAMGEGFGDYLAASFYADDGDAAYQASDAACVGDWDASDYSSASPPCLRRVDGTKTYPTDLVGSVHADGEIWSAALWEIRSQLGGTTTDTLVLEHHFNVPCSATMTDAATELLQADVNLNGGANQSAIRQTFCDRGILSGAACVVPSNLTLGYAISPDPPIAGQAATLTVTATNSSAGLLSGIQFSATVPSGTSYVASSASDGGSETGGTVSWPGTDIAAASQVQRSFEVLLDAGPGTTTLFEDDMESGSAGWTVSHGSGTYDWALGTNSPHAGSYAYFGSEPDEVTDQYLSLAAPVEVSGGTTLRFWHSYDMESTYDGGVVEVSTNGGTTWSDLGGQITQNGYDDAISSSYGSAIGGRQAFTGDSSGYVETVADLDPQAGQSALFRLRLASDSSIGGNGWFVDDVTVGVQSTLTSDAAASGGETANATLLVDIQGAPPNSDPAVGVNTGLSVDEAAMAQISSSHLQISDAEQSASALTVTVTTAPTRGSLNLGSSFTQQQIDDGSLAYTHDGSETTSDSFDFSVSDGAGGMTVGTFAIAVTPVNDPPVAIADLIDVAEGGSATALSNALTSVLANDTDADLPGDSLTAVLVTGASQGSLILNSDGSFSYTHDGSETSSDSFDYKVSDGMAFSTPATVTITVSAVNDSPVVVANTGLSVDEAGVAQITSSYLQISDAEQAASELTLTVTTAPTRGSLNLGSVFTQQQINENSLAYTHDGSETTSDSFGFSVSDGNGGTTAGTVAIVVTPVNDPPVAVADSVDVAEGGSATTLSDGLTTSVLANDTDADLPGDSLTAVLVTSASQGSLTLNSDGSFSYTHDGSETSSDSFDYKVGDGTEFSSPVTVTIAVSATNDLPDLGLSVLPDATTGLYYEVTFTPSDPDVGDTLAVVLVSSPAWLDTLVDNGDGSWSLSGTPQTGDEGNPSVTLKVSDSAVPVGEQETALALLVVAAPVVPTLLPGWLAILALMLALSGAFVLGRRPELADSSR